MAGFQEQNNRFLDPTLVIIVKIDELVRLGIQFAEVMNALQMGVMLDADIYAIKKKDEVFNALLERSSTE